MPAYRRILLASHGTDGARAAESMALRLAGAGGRLHHLIVVPDLWKGMRGDDWLNNASTQKEFGNYLESELEKELRRNIRRVGRSAGRRRLRYLPEVAEGRPADCLIASAARIKPEIVILGSPRPRGTPGLRSRVDLERLARGIGVPLLIVPYPK